jgi:hypothetical protein
VSRASFERVKLLTGQVHHDLEADLWFIEATENITPQTDIDYFELSRDEAAAWLESHEYELPESLVPSLQVDDGIFCTIGAANAVNKGQPSKKRKGLKPRGRPRASEESCKRDQRIHDG